MTGVTPTIVIRAEVSDPFAAKAKVESIAVDLQSLAQSLDIPAAIVPEAVQGDGRLILGEMSHPWEDVRAGTILGPQDVWSYAPQLISTEVVEAVWTRWFPDAAADVRDPRVGRRFGELLKSAAMSGYRIERFRNAVNGPPPATTDDWEARWEDAIAAAGCPRIRLLLSPIQHEQLLASAGDVDVTWSSVEQGSAQTLHDELGILLPPVEIAVDENLVPPWFRCEWNDLRLPPRLGITRDEILVNDSVDRMTLMGIAGVHAAHPFLRHPCATVATDQRELLQASGLTTWRIQEYFGQVVQGVVRDATGAFVNAPFVEYCLLVLEDSYPGLVAAVRSKFSLASLTRIFRGVLAEAVPVNDLTTILTALVTTRATFAANVASCIALADPAASAYVSAAATRFEDLSTREFVEVARRALRRTISDVMSRRTHTLVVYIVDQATERKLAASPRLSGTDRETLHAAVKNEIGHLPPTARAPFLLVSSNVRSRLKEELFPEQRRLGVLCYDELQPELNIQPVAKISPF